MRMLHKKRLIWAVKVGLSVGMTAWFAHRIEMPKFLDVLQNMPVMFFCSMAGVFLSSFWLNALKWQQLASQIPLSVLFRLTLVGHYYSTLMPGQVAGEAVKIFRLGRRVGKTWEVAGSVALDRIAGVVSILVVALAGAGVSRNPFPARYIPWLLAMLAAIVVSLILWRLCFDSYRDSPVSADLHSEKPFSMLRSNLRRHFDPNWVRKTGLLNALVLGIGIQLLCVAIVFALGHQMGVWVPFVDWCWIFGIVSLLVFIPATIAGIGLREAGFVSLTGLYDVPMEAALALSFSVLCLQLTAALAGALMELTGGQNAKKI